MLHRTDTPIGWYGGDPWFDTERLLYYPNGIEACRDRGFPFLVVDLRSRSVKLTTVPDYFGPEVVRWTRRDYSLRWSMGNAGEPASNLPSLLPTYLLAVVHDRDATEDAAEEHDRIERLAALGLVDGEPSPMQRFVDHPDYIVPCWRTCFKLDATTGDYVRCPVSEWVARSEKAETR